MQKTSRHKSDCIGRLTAIGNGRVNPEVTGHFGVYLKTAA